MHEQGWRLPDIFPVNTLGFQTQTRHFAMAYTSRMTRRACRPLLANIAVSDDDLGRRYGLRDGATWTSLRLPIRQLCGGRLLIAHIGMAYRL